MAETENVLLILAVLNMSNVPVDRTDEVLENPTVEQPENVEAQPETAVEESHEVPQTEEAVVEPVAETEVADTDPVPAEEPVADAEPEPSQEPEVGAEEAEPVKDESAPAEDAEEDGLPAPVEEELEEVAAEQKEIEVPETMEGIVERMKALAEHAEQSEKTELDLLKQTFYKLLKESRTKVQAEFVAAGGDPAEFKLEPEPLEEEFKKFMAEVKEQRAKILEAVEHQKEVNLEKKKAIIEKIKELVTTPEEANKNYDTFRKLQEEWKEIKPIPQSAANEVWKQFQFNVEQFYDLLKENNALRDYDFKKNLEAKTLLCEAAEKLVDDPDIIHASYQLQQLHQEFREIGPVAKELREDLWTRFKAASSAVNKRHAQYFEALKAKEEENLAKKTALCEEIENIETANLQNYSEWEQITQRIIEIQKQWKEIGRATKKMNTKIFERFRAACDNFFSKKAEHFKEQKRVFAENAAKKLALIEKAEALKDGKEWGSITNKLVQLQKEWREIGPVARKASNSLWERFNGACNYFFEQKKQALGDQRREETANLTAKKTIIEKLEALAIEAGEGAAEKVKALMDEWNATGHVPFKEKDKIYAKYRDVVDRLFKELDLSSLRRNRPPRKGEGRGSQRNDNTPRNAGGGNSLMRQYEAKKAELATYENNISFLTAQSKSGNALIDSMNKKIDDLKGELAALVERIKAQEAPAEQPVQQEEEVAQVQATETPEPEAAEPVTEE